MTAAEKLEEIAKLRKYLDEAEALLAKAGIYGRKPLFNKFDVIAMALVSKAFSVARACLLLLDNGFEDEAYGMSRSVVECAWTLRYLTQTPAEIESRTWKYFNYVRDAPLRLRLWSRSRHTAVTNGLEALLRWRERNPRSVRWELELSLPIPLLDS